MLLYQITQILYPMLNLAGAVAMILLAPRHSAAGAVGAAGFGLHFLCGVMWFLEIHSPLIQLLYLLSYGAVIAALFMMYRTKSDETQALSAPTVSPNPSPEHFQSPSARQIQMSPAQPISSQHLAAHNHSTGWGLVITWIACSAASWLMGIIGFVLLYNDLTYDPYYDYSRFGPPRQDHAAEIITCFVLSILLLIPTTITYCMWLFKSWSAVPPQYRSATPGSAVGFLFIPFFNLYWVFRCVAGLSASMRRTREAHGQMHAGGSSYGMGVTACVLMVIPYVNMLSWFFVLIWVLQANGEKIRMLNALPMQDPELPPTAG